MVRFANGHYSDCPRRSAPLAECICFTRAIRRKQDAQDALALLQRANRLTRHAPKTNARVKLALTSAGGAVRHAERVFAEVTRG